VAVGISAGVAALVSAIPALHAHILPLCLGILVLITVVNLRGTLDAGRLFALPTYVFVASFLLILGIGTWKAVMSGGAPAPVIPPPELPQVTGAVSAWLLMHAFASGCTAMTGVEAVSNGMTAFKDPSVKYGRRTLATICTILGLLLAGIAYLTQHYRILAMDQQKDGYQSVLSQLTHAVIGGGTLYFIAIGSLLCVLALSANTSFVDFPRLCRMVAQDGFLPRPFTVVGRRLVYSVGILYLAATAGLLLVLFGGITDRLIPLFAVGAFLTFTMSQTGMVVHWVRAIRRADNARTRTNHRIHLGINALGAVTTGVATVIIVVAKFADGAWITVLILPIVIIMLKLVNRYYAELDATLHQRGSLHLEAEPPVVLVVTERWDRLTDKALGFAIRVSPDVLAVYVTALEGQKEDERAIRDLWNADVEKPARRAGVRSPRLLLLPSDYRLMSDPLLRLIKDLETEYSGRTIAVLLPQIVKTSWWQYLLHTQRTRRLRSSLLRYGGSRLVVISIPWYLEEPRIEEGLAEESRETKAPKAASAR
jgi:amino acid transporter